MGSGILPEPQAAAASLSPAGTLYSRTVRLDNSSFSTSCQSGLHAVCSMQKMDQQYPEDTDTTPILTALTFQRDVWLSSINHSNRYIHKRTRYTCAIHSPSTLYYFSITAIVALKMEEKSRTSIVTQKCVFCVCVCVCWNVFVC